MWHLQGQLSSWLTTVGFKDNLEFENTKEFQIAETDLHFVL